MKNFKNLMMYRKREDYLPPDYYIKLLKTYSFSGATDIEIFDNILKSLPFPHKAMEFGCGTGRGTKQFTQNYPLSKLDILDLSSEMLEYSCKNYHIHNAILSDSLDICKIAKKIMIFVLAYGVFSFGSSTSRTL